MPKQPLSTIKNWFRRYLKPTQDQFWDTWDSFWHKDDSIPTSSITGLDTIIAGLPTAGQLGQLDAMAPVVVVVSGTGNLTIDAGRMLEHVVVEHTANGTAKVGTSAGGAEIAEGEFLANVPASFTVFQYYKNSTVVYFTGTFTAKVYTR